MNQGVFEQIGTPNEIYYKPETSYVASFVGDANIYRQNGKLYAVRSENVLIHGEAECIYDATVLEKSFAGGQLRILFELSDGQKITASRYGIDAEVMVGQQMKIGWAAGKSVEVKEQKGGSYEKG